MATIPKTFRFDEVQINKMSHIAAKDKRSLNNYLDLLFDDTIAKNAELLKDFKNSDWKKDAPVKKSKKK